MFTSTRNCLASGHLPWTQCRALRNQMADGNKVLVLITKFPLAKCYRFSSACNATGNNTEISLLLAVYQLRSRHSSNSVINYSNFLRKLDRPCFSAKIPRLVITRKGSFNDKLRMAVYLTLCLNILPTPDSPNS